LMTGFP
jgi:magnesium transporter